MSFGQMPEKKNQMRETMIYVCVNVVGLEVAI